MANLTRRGFSHGLAASALLAPALAKPALALGEAKVVIVGGGPGGASVAVMLKKADPKLDITIFEPKSKFSTCFFSNHYLGGYRSFSSLTHSYKGISALGIKVVHETVAGIEASQKRIVTTLGRRYGYDRLVVAPGIDLKFDGIEGYSEDAAEVMPHAWKAGSQTQMLRGRLERLENGGTVVISAPRLPYRCPPGPYERACVMAAYLKAEKPKSKLVILDAKMTFSKQAAFQEAFDTHYKGIVELHLTNDIDDHAVARVDTRTGEVTTKAGLTVKAALANIIPEQTAGRLALDTGLAENGWCPVHLETFASKLMDNVYVLGDAAIANEMPKSAFTAHSQAGVVSSAILAELSGRPREEARLRNTCWSLVAPGMSIKIGGDYAPGEAGGKAMLVPSNSFVSKPGEPESLRREVYEESLAWYSTLVSEVWQKPMQL